MVKYDLGFRTKVENSISVSISAAAIPSIVAFLFEAFNRASELFGILVFCCSHIHNDEPIFKIEQSLNNDSTY